MGCFIKLKNIYVDIDDTICYCDKNDLRYENAKPYLERIKKINELYEKGHTIHYWTARGTKTGLDWRELTEQQFEDWGVKYHFLSLGKPAYDLMICDKTQHPDIFFKNKGE